MLRKVLPALFMVVVAAMAHADKISGFVKGSVTGKTFTVGSNKGQFTVDASKAKVTMKGKFFSLSKLTGGSQVTVEGKLKGKNMMATSVAIGSLGGAKKPVTKPGVKPTTKPMTKPTTKTGKTDSKGKGKTDDKTKSKGK